MNQIQCPNCGGYEVFIPPGCLFHLAAALPLPIIFEILMGSAHKQGLEAFYRGQVQARCQLCGFVFSVHQLPTEPVEPNIRLIEAGKRRLEEERRRRMWD